MTDRTHRGITLFVAGVYAILVLLTQLGSVSREIINWDESTFMLLGADILDGILPYTERFDNKPPMIFFLMGGWMGLFGETVLSARLFGDACLWLTAIFVFLIGRRMAGPLAAGAAGGLFIAMNAVEPGLHSSAGLPAMAMMMAALWLCLAWRDRVWAMVLAGALVSLAVLTRSNLAYAALASGLWFALVGFWRPGTGRLFRWSPFAYAAGGAIPVAALVLVYAQAGALAELKLGAVDVALSYSKQWGLANAFVEHLRKWAEAVKAAPVLYGSFTLVTGLALVLTLLPPLQERPSRLG
ncbi:glycosyltransferase family 39 protein, partial [Rhodovulum sp.]|uniref:glycosyltransferase family 39 protein n=1 Tax=Rhodovulum sp. TaxID=34009 RepID=UPI0017D7F4D2